MRLLAEELFLLSIDHKTKRPYGRAASLLSYTLNSALLAELIVRECIVIQDEKVVLVQEIMEDALLQETINIIQAKPNQSTKQMIATLRRKHQNIQVKLTEKLDGKGDLTVEKKEILGAPIASFYKVTREDELEQYRKKFAGLMENYKENQQLDDDLSTIILLALVYHSNLLRIVFPEKSEAKEVERFVKKMNEDLPVSKSVKQIIEAVNTSVLAAAAHFTL